MQEKAAQLGKGPSVLVLSPTRELAAQTARVLKQLVPGTALKGSLLAKSTAAGTEFGKVDVLLATPLLLVESLQASKVSLALCPTCFHNVCAAWSICKQLDLLSRAIVSGCTRLAVCH